MSDAQRNKDKQMGWIISAAVHAALILLFFFILAWQAPDPPLPEYGIELNFGLEPAGSGFEQPTVTPSPPTETEQGEPQEQIVEEQEQQVEEEVESEPIEESSTEELIDSQQEDSPVETQLEEYEEPSPPVEEEIEKERQSEEQKTLESEVVEQPAKKPVLNKDALMQPRGSSSQGSKEDDAGDAGNPEGSKDSPSLSGKSGGGGGTRLDLAGWDWLNEPNPEDNSTYSGEIVFKIKVNENGEVEKVSPISYGVPISVLNIYRDAVYNLKFKPKQDNALQAPSEGKITFIIRSK